MMFDTESTETSNPPINLLESSRILAHSIEPNDLSYSEIMPDAFFVNEPPKRKTRFRYICYGCHAKVYGKPKLHIRCEDCNQAL